MKILILVITVTWSFSTPYPPPTSIMVGSLELAAWEVWEDKYIDQQFFSPRDKKTYQLFEIDLETKQIKEVPLPVVKIETKLETQNAINVPGPYEGDKEIDWINDPLSYMGEVTPMVIKELWMWVDGEHKKFIWDAEKEGYYQEVE